MASPLSAVDRTAALSQKVTGLQRDLSLLSRSLSAVEEPFGLSGLYKKAAIKVHRSQLSGKDTNLDVVLEEQTEHGNVQQCTVSPVLMFYSLFFVHIV